MTTVTLSAQNVAHDTTMNCAICYAVIAVITNRDTVCGAEREWMVKRMRLIDADAYKKRNAEIIDCEIDHYKYQDTLRELIDDSPTIDAEPVVRCKDCKWWTKQEKSIQGRCALYGMYPTGGWYCANGRRNDEID